MLATLFGMQRSGLRPSQRQLADRTGLEALYVSKLARALEAAGLVERVEHPDDSRAVQLSLTGQGRAVTGRAIAIVRDLHGQLLAPLGGRTRVVRARRPAPCGRAGDDAPSSRGVTGSGDVTAR